MGALVRNRNETEWRLKMHRLKYVKVQLVLCAGCDGGLQGQMTSVPGDTEFITQKSMLCAEVKVTLHTHSCMEADGCGFNACDANMGKASWMGT